LGRKGKSNRFQPVRWNLVLLSAQSQTTSSKNGFADLYNSIGIRRIALIWHRGFSPEDAQEALVRLLVNLLQFDAPKSALVYMAARSWLN
jgi:hypothetical protein